MGKYYPPSVGGIERIVSLLSTELSKEPGVEVDVLVANSQPHTTRENDGLVKVTRLGTYGVFRNIPITPRMLAAARGFKDYDLVHIHSPNPIVESSVLTLRPSVPIVASDWGAITQQKMLWRLWKPLYTKYFASVNALAIPSRRYAERMAHLQPALDRFFEVPLGVDLGALASTPQIEEKAKQLRGDKKRNVVLCVGRLVRFKGASVLLRAAGAIDAEILIVGDGPEREPLVRLANSLRLADSVKFLGTLRGADLVAAYRSADVFVLPSIGAGEAFTQALLEALCCGVPAVTTELGTGTSEINVHGVTGLIVPPNDPTLLAAAVNQILGDPEMAARMRAAALGRARTHYSIDTMRRRLVECYEFCLQN